MASGGTTLDLVSKQGARRPFSINNAFVPGMQALGAVPTLGRISSSWDNLRAAAADVVAYSLAGTAFVTVDIGGNSMDPPADELLVRWYQLGVLTTVTRCNSARTSSPHFPFSAKDPLAVQAIHKALALRTSLQPTLYSALVQQHARLEPMLRPLMLDFPDDERASGVETQWMIGGSLLVAPVVSASSEVDVYLPSARWYPFDLSVPETPTDVITGPGVRAFKATLGDIPMFAREGSLVALQEQGQGPPSPPSPPGLLTVFVYGGSNATLEVVEDDGMTYSAMFRVTTFTWDDARLVLSWKRMETPSLPAGAAAAWSREQTQRASGTSFSAGQERVGGRQAGDGFVVVQAVLWQNATAPIQSHVRNIGPSGFIDFSTFLATSTS